MYKVYKMFQKVKGELVEVPLSKSFNVKEASYFQTVFDTDEDMPSGSYLGLPEGMYDPENDMLIVNYEGFMLTPNIQYRENSATELQMLLDIYANTYIHVLVWKLSTRYVSV